MIERGRENAMRTGRPTTCLSLPSGNLCDSNATNHVRGSRRDVTDQNDRKFRVVV